MAGYKYEVTFKTAEPIENCGICPFCACNECNYDLDGWPELRTWSCCAGGFDPVDIDNRLGHIDQDDLQFLEQKPASCPLKLKED